MTLNTTGVVIHLDKICFNMQLFGVESQVCSSPQEESNQANNVFIESSLLQFQDKVVQDEHQSYQILFRQGPLNGCQFHKVVRQTRGLM